MPKFEKQLALDPRGDIDYSTKNAVNALENRTFETVEREIISTTLNLAVEHSEFTRAVNDLSACRTLLEQISAHLSRNAAPAQVFNPATGEVSPLQVRATPLPAIPARFVYKIVNATAVTGRFRSSGGGIDHMALRKLCADAMETGVCPQEDGIEFTDTLA